MSEIKREERLDKNNSQEQGLDKKYILATNLLEGIWLHINWY